MISRILLDIEQEKELDPRITHEKYLARDKLPSINLLNLDLDLFIYFSCFEIVLLSL